MSRDDGMWGTRKWYLFPDLMTPFAYFALIDLWRRVPLPADRLLAVAQIVVPLLVLEFIYNVQVGQYGARRQWQNAFLISPDSWGGAWRAFQRSSSRR